MDDTNEENFEENWVFLNPVEVAEEAVNLNSEDNVDDNNLEEKVLYKDVDLLEFEYNDVDSKKNTEPDSDSDGISIISESSHLLDNTDEENNEENLNKYCKIHENEEISDVNAENKEELTVENIETISDPLERFDVQDTEDEEISQHVEDNIGTTRDFEPFQEAEDVNLIENPPIHGEVFSNIPVYRKYLNNFIIGTILLLSSSIFLGHYFNVDEKLSSEDFAFYDQYLGPDSDNKLPESFVKGKKFDVSTALIYCEEKYINGERAYRNMQNCLRRIDSCLKRRREISVKESAMKDMQKQLEIKENFLNEKEKYLARKELELNFKETGIKNEAISSGEVIKKIDVEETDVNSEEVSIEIGTDMEDESQEIHEQYKKQKNNKKIYHKKNHEEKQKKYDNKFKKPHGEDNFEDEKDDQSKDKPKYKKCDENKCKYKYDDCKMNNGKFKKYDYRIKEGKYENDDCKDDNNCKKYQVFQKEYDEFDDSDDEDDDKGKKNKKLKEYSSKQKKKYKEGKEKYQKDKKIKSKDKQNQFYNEKSNYKYYNNCKEDRRDRKYESGTNYVLIDNKNDTDSISGYWVGKLYKARSDLRNKETSGEWYFDRASYRKRKRDKARWYFDWMFDRELMRYKRSDV